MYTQSLPRDDWESDQTPYSPKKLYARTKREQVMITEVTRRPAPRPGRGRPRDAPGMGGHRGLTRAMPGFRTVMRPLLRTADEGADTIVWLGAAPEPLRETGLFWHDRRPRPTHYRVGPSPGAGDRGRAELWAYCEAALAAAGIGPL